MRYFAAFIAALAPILALPAPRGLVPLAVLGALPGLAALWRNRAWRRLDAPLAALFGLLFAWAALSALWRIPTAETIEHLPQLAGMLLLAVILPAAARSTPDEIAGRALTAGLLAGSAFLMAEIVTDGAILTALGKVSWSNSLKPGVTVLALAIWPAAAWLLGRRNRTAALAVPLLVIGPVSQIGGDTATIAAFIGAAAFALALLLPQLVALGAAILAAALAFGMPALAPVLHHWTFAKGGAEWLPSSMIHRVAIWNFAAEQIAGSPWVGLGFKAARGFPGGDVDIDNIGPALPLHTHNVFLQWWLELGLVGVLIGLAVILLLIWRAFRMQDQAMRAGALAVLASGLVINSAAFGAWQSWWWAAMILVGAAIIALSRKEA